MTPDEFVKAFVDQRDEMLGLYMDAQAGTAVGSAIASMGLDSKQLETMKSVLKDVLTDTFYTTLVALDGGASLGSVQESYSVRAEDGTELTGTLGEKAWRAFHQ